MLDDLKYINSKDKSDALGLIAKQGVQLCHEFGVLLDLGGEVNNVILAGMGGSGWPMKYILSWPGINVPAEVWSDYDLPVYAGKNTLVIVSSYSGNTEETLSALEKAEEKECMIIVLSAGGKLSSAAEDKGMPLYKIPSGIQPRMSSFYFIAAFIDIFSQLDLSITKPLDDEVREISDWLNQEIANLLPEVPVSKNPAKQLALEIIGKTPIIYSGGLLAPVAQKMKICMNENAKNTAWWGQYPEFCHNEFMGWSSHPQHKPFAVIDFRSSLDHPRVKKRFEVVERLLSGKRPHPNVVVPHGDGLAKQLFWSSVYADFVCTYVALLNGVDPTPVVLVEKLKKDLDS